MSGLADSTKAVGGGCCWLVGAGPGDVGLLTLRGRECIETADVIVYDYLCNPELLKHAREGAEIIYAGKKAGAHTLPQGGINELLVEKVSAGKRVARLKGGDPFLFGRGGEEAEALAAAGLDFEVVPGVSSAIAGPAYAGIPVTHREHASQLTIFTGHEDPSRGETALDFAQLAAAPGTKVMLMGVERLKELSERLVAAGASPETPVALIRWATTARQQSLIGSVGDIAQRASDSGFKAPAIAVIGDVVKLRARLSWFEQRPLFGKRIVVTRSRPQAGALSARLALLGADVLELPTIRIEPPTDRKALELAVVDAHRYDWLVFTSPNGVDAFFRKFYEQFSDARAIGGVRIAVIGPATAAKVREWRLAVDLQPDTFVAEGLIKAFAVQEGTVENLQFLLVRAEQARDVLPQEWAAGGAIVDEVCAYRTVPEDRDLTGAVARLREEGADLVTFTSSSTVEHFAALGLPWPEGMQGASIGPVTSATMRSLGIPIAVEAAQQDIPGLVEAICGLWRDKA